MCTATSWSVSKPHTTAIFLLLPSYVLTRWFLFFCCLNPHLALNFIQPTKCICLLQPELTWPFISLFCPINQFSLTCWVTPCLWSLFYFFHSICSSQCFSELIVFSKDAKASVNIHIYSNSGHKANITFPKHICSSFEQGSRASYNPNNTTKQTLWPSKFEAEGCSLQPFLITK